MQGNITQAIIMIYEKLHNFLSCVIKAVFS